VDFISPFELQRFNDPGWATDRIWRVSRFFYGRFLALPALHGADLESLQRADFVEKVACRDDVLLIHFSQ